MQGSARHAWRSSPSTLAASRCTRGRLPSTPGAGCCDSARSGTGRCETTGAAQLPLDFGFRSFLGLICFRLLFKFCLQNSVGSGSAWSLSGAQARCLVVLNCVGTWLHNIAFKCRHTSSPHAANPQPHQTQSCPKGYGRTRHSALRGSAIPATQSHTSSEPELVYTAPAQAKTPPSSLQGVGRRRADFAFPGRPPRRNGGFLRLPEPVPQPAVLLLRLGQLQNRNGQPVSFQVLAVCCAYFCCTQAAQALELSASQTSAVAPAM